MNTDGAKSNKAKKYTYVINPPLLTGDKKKTLEVVNIPGLHTVRLELFCSISHFKYWVKVVDYFLRVSIT